MPVEILVALIGLGGVTFGGVVQWLVARSTIRAETERLHRQLSSEFRLAQFSEWQSRFQSVMADLLVATDPEAGAISQSAIVPLVIRAQLMLNPELPSHARANGLINQLALATGGWHGEPDAQSILSIHAALLDAAKTTLYLPGK